MFKLLTKLIKDRDNISDFNVRSKYGVLCSIVGIISNLLLSSVKILIGILAGSIAIIADGINNLTDSASSIVTWIGFKISSTPADSKHPFGHERIEYISGFIVSIVIIVVGILLMKTSIETIITPEELDLDKFYIIIIILIVSILIKLWQSVFYKKAGKKISSTALMATSRDSLNDTITTFATLISLIIVKFIGWQLDGYFGVAISIFIIIGGIKLVKETISPLIGEAPSKDFVDMVITKIHSYQGVLGIHDLVIHNYGPAKTFITVHVEVDAKIDVLISHDMIDNIEQDFLKDNRLNVVIHMDPIDTSDEYTKELKEVINKILNNIDESLMFHDFRVVRGITHTNVLFDVVVPPKYKFSENELKSMILEKIKEYDNTLNGVIVIDQNYID